MDVKQLTAIHTLIKSKKVDRTYIMEKLWDIAWEDVGLYAKENGEIPSTDKLISQYKELPHFEIILSTINISIPDLEKFLGVLITSSEVDDFTVAELK